MILLSFIEIALLVIAELLADVDCLGGIRLPVDRVSTTGFILTILLSWSMAGVGYSSTISPSSNSSPFPIMGSDEEVGRGEEAQSLWRSWRNTSGARDTRSFKADSVNRPF